MKTYLRCILHLTSKFFVEHVHYFLFLLFPFFCFVEEPWALWWIQGIISFILSWLFTENSIFYVNLSRKRYSPTMHKSVPRPTKTVWSATVSWLLSILASVWLYLPANCTEYVIGFSVFWVGGMYNTLCEMVRLSLEVCVYQLKYLFGHIRLSSHWEDVQVDQVNHIKWIFLTSSC